MCSQPTISAIENNLAAPQIGIFTAYHSNLVTGPDNRQHTGAGNFQAHFTAPASNAVD
jgi:hypothetical protein